MIGDSGRLGWWARRLWLLGATIGVAVAACSGDQRGGERLGSASHALTTEQQRILGFESVGAGARHAWVLYDNSEAVPVLRAPGEDSVSDRYKAPSKTQAGTGRCARV